MSHLLHLLHLASPALPVGAYAYSQGQEYAVDAQWLRDEPALRSWIGDVLQFGLAKLDLPILCRLYAAWENNNLEQLQYWDAYLRASRETHELLLEDEQMGTALQRLLNDLGVAEAETGHSFAYYFSLAGQHWGIPLAELLQAFAWSWLENQVAAASKSVPLGQTQGQKILIALMPDVERACADSLAMNDDDIGLSMPGLALASSLHERQYSRLFRS